MYDIIVIGAGPAGMTAAIYARRASKTVLVLEAVTYGGQIINTPDIENYPVTAHISGFDFSTKVYEQAKDLGAEFVFEKAVEIRDENGVKTVVTPKNAYEAKAVILATGSENRKLGLENEDALVGRGVSYCATCDGNFFRKKTVAVVGGGNTALEDALYLADLCEKVYLIHRRDSFRGEEANAERLKARENVEFVYNSNVTRLIAEKRLKAIEVTNRLDGSVRTIELNGLFIAVGRVPENQNFGSLVKLDESGYVIAGEDCHTNYEGIFVAGDTRTKALRQLVTATADGAMAATEAVKYINNL
ncbi:MAG: FAD-dependent oxidoreductase [Firmicutes bacterium]|nr:FAD-dependent oxidoreductase [Eubacterium sp.]MBQ3411458.1 FAD-dependent oxidoreductase [Oscillospiraceae bacterium]MBR0126706.1 FAD-dependent oxidoreductase [Bacillota bacterium]